MTLPFGLHSSQTKRAAILLGLAAALVTTMSLAQETTSDAKFDSAVIDLFVESSIRKPATEATAQEKADAIKQLEDIYNVTNLQRAKELANEPRIRAQIELQQRVILFQRFAADYLSSNPATEQELFNEYAEQTSLAPTKEYKARHILLETQAQALDVIAELQGGADFEELAKAKSTGPSGATGGDLGWFGPQSMVKPFSDAVVVLQDDAYTREPVQSQFGWHVILREDSRDSTPPPLDSVRDVIKQRVEQAKLQDFIDGLRS